MLQLLGFSDIVTGAIGTCTMVGAAIGFLVGGGAGDFLAIRYPNAARPAINQLSMVFAAPLYIAFLKGLPGGPMLHMLDACTFSACSMQETCILTHVCLSCLSMFVSFHVAY